MKYSKKIVQPNEKVVDAQRKGVQKSRRKFLDLVAKSGIATSTLKYSSILGGVMTARYAQAQAASPKRVVYCYIHSGAPADWKPSSPSNISSSASCFHYGPGSHNVADICHFRGVDTEVAGHGGARQALGADYSRNTVDMDLGGILGPSSYYSTIFLSSNEGGTGANIVISKSGLPVSDPREALSKYFGALPEIGTDDTYLKSFAAQKRAVESIKNKLSSEERERLDTHFVAIEKIEQRISDLANATAPDLDAYKPNIPGGYDDSSNAGMVEHAKLQADVLVAAFQADLTRVGVLQIGNHNGNGWTYRGFDGHSAAHSGGASVWNPMMREKFEVPAYFIKKLTETMDSNGQPLIETTAFCQVTCFGNGLSHSSADAPFLLATRMAGFRSGFSSRGTSSTSRDFHAEVAKGLGVNPSGLSLAGATGGNVDLTS